MELIFRLMAILRQRSEKNIKMGMRMMEHQTYKIAIRTKMTRVLKWYLMRMAIDQ